MALISNRGTDSVSGVSKAPKGLSYAPINNPDMEDRESEKDVIETIRLKDFKAYSDDVINFLTVIDSNSKELVQIFNSMLSKKSDNSSNNNSKNKDRRIKSKDKSKRNINKDRQTLSKSEKTKVPLIKQNQKKGKEKKNSNPPNDIETKISNNFPFEKEDVTLLRDYLSHQLDKARNQTSIKKPVVKNIQVNKNTPANPVNDITLNPTIRMPDSEQDMSPISEWDKDLESELDTINDNLSLLHNSLTDNNFTNLNVNTNQPPAINSEIPETIPSMQMPEISFTPIINNVESSATDLGLVTSDNEPAIKVPDINLTPVVSVEPLITDSNSNIPSTELIEISESNPTLVANMDSLKNSDINTNPSINVETPVVSLTPSFDISPIIENINSNNDDNINNGISSDNLNSFFSSILKVINNKSDSTDKVVSNNTDNSVITTDNSISKDTIDNRTFNNTVSDNRLFESSSSNRSSIFNDNQTFNNNTDNNSDNSIYTTSTNNRSEVYNSTDNTRNISNSLSQDSKLDGINNSSLDTIIDILSKNNNILDIIKSHMWDNSQTNDSSIQVSPQIDIQTSNQTDIPLDNINNLVSDLEGKNNQLLSDFILLQKAKTNSDKSHIEYRPDSKQIIDFYNRSIESLEAIKNLIIHRISNNSNETNISDNKDTNILPTDNNEEISNSVNNISTVNNTSNNSVNNNIPVDTLRAELIKIDSTIVSLKDSLSEFMNNVSIDYNNNSDNQISDININPNIYFNPIIDISPIKEFLDTFSTYDNEKSDYLDSFFSSVKNNIDVRDTGKSNLTQDFYNTSNISNIDNNNTDNISNINNNTSNNDDNQVLTIDDSITTNNVDNTRNLQEITSESDLPEIIVRDEATQVDNLPELEVDKSNNRINDETELLPTIDKNLSLLNDIRNQLLSDSNLIDIADSILSELRYSNLQGENSIPVINENNPADIVDTITGDNNSNYPLIAIDSLLNRINDELSSSPNMEPVESQISPTIDNSVTESPEYPDSRQISQDMGFDSDSKDISSLLPSDLDSQTNEPLIINPFEDNDFIVSITPDDIRGEDTTTDRQSEIAEETEIETLSQINQTLQTGLIILSDNLSVAENVPVIDNLPIAENISSVAETSEVSENIPLVDDNNTINNSIPTTTREDTVTDSDEDLPSYFSQINQTTRNYSDSVAEILKLKDLGFKDTESLEAKLSDEDKLILETEIKMTDSVRDLWDELNSADTETREGAEKLLQANQEEIYSQYEKDILQLRNDQFNEETEVLQKHLDRTAEVMEKNDSSIRGSLLGPLNLLLNPMEEFFDFDLGGMLRDKLFGNKEARKNPNESDVAKIGTAGAGYLYVANTIRDTFGDEQQADEDRQENVIDNLENIFGADTVSKAKQLMTGKNISMAGLIAGVAWTTVDAVGGYFQAEEWGTTKVASTIGGAIAGTGEGFPNAAKNGAKWALTAGSAGFAVGGPVGALVGALGGLVFGAVGGYIGGEEVSKDIQNAVDVIFTDKTMKDVQSENMLADVQERVDAGEATPEYQSAMTELSETIPTEDFAKLGKRTFESDAGASADWILEYGKGTFDTLSDESQTALEDEYFGVEGLDASSRKEMLTFYKWLGESFSESLVKKVIKSKESLYDFVQTMEDILDEDDEKYQALASSYIRGADVAGATLAYQFQNEGIKAKGGPWKSTILKDFKKKQSVDDAIIQPDGSVIETNPKDTLVALKDIPQSSTSLFDNQRELENKLSTTDEGDSNSNSMILQKLDKLVVILQQILQKDPPKLVLPPMNRQDLDLIMNGGIV